MAVQRLWSACFSGYRPEKFGFSLLRPGPQLEVLRRALEEAIRAASADGYSVFYCGGARGFDILAGETVLALRKELPALRLCLALPFPGQAAGFEEAWRARHDRLCEAADEVKVLSPVYTHACYFERNRYMVERASLLICYYDGKRGGTGQTVRLAGRLGLIVQNLAQNAPCTF